MPGPSPYGGPNDPTQFGDQNANHNEYDGSGVDFLAMMIRQEDDGEEKLIPDTPEKVSVLETPIAKSHTTFYPQHKH